MRHLWSFLAGVVAAPLTWILIALGQDGSARTVTNWVSVGTFTAANLIEPAVYLAVAGVVLGLLGTLRFSPLGPLVAGLLLLGPYVGLFIDPFAVRDRVPATWEVLGDPLPLRLPLDNGTLLLIGTLLLMAMFSVQRWRRWPAPAPVEAPADGPAWAPPGFGDPGGQSVPDWSTTEPGRESDTTPLTLGYPQPAPPPPPPYREGESPWSVPPRSSAQRGYPPD